MAGAQEPHLASRTLLAFSASHHIWMWSILTLSSWKPWTMKTDALTLLASML